MNTNQIEAKLKEVVELYPSQLQASQYRDIPRIAYNVSLSLSGLNLEETTICDLGGGLGLFTPACAALGCKKVILVDDFKDDINLKNLEAQFSAHKELGVEIISSNIISEELTTTLNEPIDVFTSFDCLEHLHHSPKQMLHQAMSLLKENGRFIIGVPNSVNLRKRLTVPFGQGKWSPLEEWYEKEVFRGHVREPDVADLNYIGKDMGLVNRSICGRNWLGLDAGSQIVRMLTKLSDPILSKFPSLCSNIYLFGEKSS